MQAILAYTEHCVFVMMNEVREVLSDYLLSVGFPILAAPAVIAD